jgi:hypothetical protein
VQIAARAKNRQRERNGGERWLIPHLGTTPLRA